MRLKAARAKLSAIIGVAEINAKLHAERAEVVLTLFSKVYSLEKLSPESVADEADVDDPVQQFIEKIGAHSVATPTRGFADKLVCSDGCSGVTLAVKKTAGELAGTLPYAVRASIESCSTYACVLPLSENISQGKLVLAIERVRVLNSAHQVVQRIQEKPEWQGHVDNVNKTFEQCWIGQVKPHASGKTTEEFMQNKFVVTEAVESWNFDAVPWMSTTALDVARDAENKRVEQFVLNFPSASRIAEELASLLSNMEWSSTAIRADLKQVVDELERSRQVATRASLLLATIVLANSVLTGGKQLQQFKTYCNKALKVAIRRSPQQVAEGAREFFEGREDSAGRCRKRRSVVGCRTSQEVEAGEFRLLR